MDIIIRTNHEKNPSYAPYCGRCSGLVRMKVVLPFYWRCDCGAQHDERIFFFSINKIVSSMTLDELNEEIGAAEEYYERCRAGGFGIGSKEGARKRECEDRRNALMLKGEPNAS